MSQYAVVEMCKKALGAVASAVNRGQSNDAVDP